MFEGTVIAIKGSGISKTFTVRRLSYGVGVERVFPMHSPNVVDVKVVRSGKVRRAKLYYLRDRVGNNFFLCMIKNPVDCNIANLPVCRKN